MHLGDGAERPSLEAKFSEAVTSSRPLGQAWAQGSAKKVAQGGRWPAHRSSAKATALLSLWEATRWKPRR